MQGLTVEVLDGHKEGCKGRSEPSSSTLMDLIKFHDPDLILCPNADTWVQS